MKIDYCSDLHLEWGYQTLPGGEVLVLAGDICEARSLLKDFHSTRAVDRQPGSFRFWDFFEYECAKYQQVFMVMGNHDHYHGRFDRTYDELNRVLPANLKLLENDTVEYGGVVFCGATLWTDCNRGDPNTVWTLKQRMTDYRAIKTHRVETATYGKLSPQDSISTHRNSLQYLKETVGKYPEQPVVVITHHAPSFASIHESYRDERELNGGYASELGEFILDNPQIEVWVHGHTHHGFDYQIGSTRVVCNPRGYLGQESQTDTFQVKSFTVDSPLDTVVARGSWE
jgi:Icc-related predicted phosphoesterase